MSKLFKGIKKVFKKIKKVTKRIVKSKLFKYVAVAAAIYFGGAGLSSMMNGGTFSAGVGSAGASLSQAGSSLMAQEFTAAGSTLSNAWGTAGSIGSGLGTTGTMSSAYAATQTGLTSGNIIAGVGAGTGTANIAAKEFLVEQKLLMDGVSSGAISQSEGVTMLKGVSGAGSSSGGISIGEAMLANTGVQAVSGYLDAREQEKQDKKDRMRKTYYGVNGYGETAEGGMPSLMIKPPSVGEVFNNTNQLTNHRYGVSG